MSQAAITILAAAIGVFGSLLGAVVGGVTSYCAELKLRERRRSRQALKEIEERIKDLHSEVVHTYVNGITGDEEVDAVEIRAEALEIVKM
jgi:gas vesicle protein